MCIIIISLTIYLISGPLQSTFKNSQEKITVVCLFGVKRTVDIHCVTYFLTVGPFVKTESKLGTTGPTHKKNAHTHSSKSVDPYVVDVLSLRSVSVNGSQIGGSLFLSINTILCNNRTKKSTCTMGYRVRSPYVFER